MNSGFRVWSFGFLGIRKVLGATTSQIRILLSKDFIILVLVSCVIQAIKAAMSNPVKNLRSE